MRKTIFIAGMLMLAASLAPATIHAQLSLRDDVESQIQRNEELVGIARDLVAQTNSVKARTILQSGLNLHDDCKKMFALSEDQLRQGHELMARQMMNKARDLARAAREAVLRAMSVAKREAMTEESAWRSIEQARERYERAVALMNESSGSEAAAARKMLEESREHLERAGRNLREHMYEVSLRLADLSLSLSDEAMNTLRRETGSKDTATGELQKAEQLIARIEEHAGVREHPEAERSYREALGLRNRAAESLRGNKFRAAFDYAARARNQALRTLQMLSSKYSRENAEQAIGLTDHLLDKAFELAGAAGAGDVVRRLEEARALQEKARGSLSRNEFENALGLTRRARNAIQETVNRMETPLSSEGVKAALIATDAVLDEARGADGLADDPAAQDLLREAEKHQASARDAFDQSLLKMALTHTKLARTFVTRAVEHIHNERR